MVQGKRFLLSFSIVLLSLLLLCALFVGLVDPYYVIHYPMFGLKPILSNVHYRVNGLIQNASYEGLLLGTSMTETFPMEAVDAAYQMAPGSTVHILAHGMHSKDYEARLQAIARKGQASYLLVGLDGSVLFKPSDSLRISELPAFALNPNVINITEYFFNSTVIFQDIPEFIQKNHAGFGGQSSVDRLSYLTYSEKVAYKHYHPPSAPLSPEQKKQKLATARQNIQIFSQAFSYITDIPVDAFIPPYSILNWHSAFKEGILDETLELYTELCRTLLQQKNIRLFIPMLDTERILNLSYYRDAGHYSSELSLLIITDIQTGANQITLDNLDEKMAAFGDFIHSVDWSVYEPT